MERLQQGPPGCTTHTFALMASRCDCLSIVIVAGAIAPAKRNPNNASVVVNRLFSSDFSSDRSRSRLTVTGNADSPQWLRVPSSQGACRRLSLYSFQVERHCSRSARRMKGKKQHQTAVEATTPTPHSAHSDLSAHSAFFDSLVELVPAKYYFEPEEPLLNLKYMKKADRAAAKRALKEQYRKSKRAKLDPDAVQSTLEVQQARAEKHKLAEPLEADTREGGDLKAGPPRLSFHSQNGEPSLALS